MIRQVLLRQVCFLVVWFLSGTIAATIAILLLSKFGAAPVDDPIILWSAAGFASGVCTLALIRRFATGWPIGRQLATEVSLLRHTKHFYALVSLMGLSACFSLLVARVIRGDQPMTRFTLHPHTWAIVAGFMSLAVLTPIAEELCFRRWMWNDIGTVTGQKVAGLCVCIIFTAMHLYPNPSAGLVILPLALLLWAARSISGSIVPGIAMHGFHNGCALFVAALF